MVFCPCHLLQRGRLSDNRSPEDAITTVASHREGRTQIVVVTSVLVTGLLSVIFTVAGWEVAVFGSTVLPKCVGHLFCHGCCISPVGALYFGGLVC